MVESKTYPIVGKLCIRIAIVHAKNSDCINDKEIGGLDICSDCEWNLDDSDYE